MIPQETLSLLLGYVSIGFWLGAQFPQLVVNWRRKSVDGLSLPFLANWLIGDTTNLLGCLLTNQLPFQTYLATYFVFVDSSLVIQYFYYDAPRASVLSSASSIIAPARSRSRAPSSSSLIMSPPPGDNIRKLSTIPSISPSRPRAKSFDLMTDANSRVRAQTQLAEHAPSYGHDQPDADNDDIEPDSNMITSFYSEGGERHSGRGKHVSWSRGETSRDHDHNTHTTTRHRQRSGSLGLMTTTDNITEEHFSTSPTTLRGRPIMPRRMTGGSIESDYNGDDLVDASPVRFPSDPSDMDKVDSTPLVHSRSHSRVRRASSALSEAASRRSASIVFLGAIVLIGFSRLHFNAYPYSTITTQGSVLLPLEYHSDSHITPLSPRNSSFIDDNQTTQQLIGRISAWTCATLYLTSRLPQIWKNFIRKSVEGLSMYLFAFAFFGNLFYVLSILTSPNMNLPPEQSRQFLRDSVPYLLGSGGTLLFDITIVSQSFIYASGINRRGRKKQRMRSRTLSGIIPGTSTRSGERVRRESRRTIDDEERGLLQGDRDGERGDDAM